MGIFLACAGVFKPANCIMVAGRKRAAAISAALRTGISLSLFLATRILLQLVCQNFSPSVCQPREQFGMDAVEAAVAENADHIPAERVLANVPDYRIRIRQISRLFAGSLDVRHQLFGI
jgi:hypothetical protein